MILPIPDHVNVNAIRAQPMLTRNDISNRFGTSIRQRILTSIAGTMIRVTDKTRRYVFPAFQFTQEGPDVDPVVGAINLLLGAREDPWGVASWWFSPNTFLPESQAPHKLVTGSIEDRALILKVAFENMASSSG